MHEIAIGLNPVGSSNTWLVRFDSSIYTVLHRVGEAIYLVNCHLVNGHLLFTMLMLSGHHEFAKEIMPFSQWPYCLLPFSLFTFMMLMLSGHHEFVNEILHIV